MTCNHCLPPCECGAEAEAGLRLLRMFGFSTLVPPRPAPRWPELEAMERALADYGATKEAA